MALSSEHGDHTDFSPCGKFVLHFKQKLCSVKSYGGHTQLGQLHVVFDFMKGVGFYFEIMQLNRIYVALKIQRLTTEFIVSLEFLQAII